MVLEITTRTPVEVVSSKIVLEDKTVQRPLLLEPCISISAYV